VAEFKKGDIVLVSAFTWSDYIDNHLRTVYKDGFRTGPPKREMDPDIEIYFDPRKEKLHGYLAKRAENSDNWRALMRRKCEESMLCLVVGLSTRQTGYRAEECDGDMGQYRYGYLTGVKVHKVVMVVPYEGQRYSKPESCMAEDLEKT